jgi:hypothetical protein
VLLALIALEAIAAAGCGRGEGPRVRVVNASGRRLDAIWVRTELDSVHVPTLAPGESVEVRPRVRGEALLWISGRFGRRPIDSPSSIPRATPSCGSSDWGCGSARRPRAHE